MHATEGESRLSSSDFLAHLYPVDGVLRGKYMSKNKFLSAAKSGFGFVSCSPSLLAHSPSSGRSARR